MKNAMLPRQRRNRWLAVGMALAVLVPLVARLGLAAEKPSGPQGGDYKLSGPFTHENLTIFLIHGKGQQGWLPLTLHEALEQKKLIVHETGRVSELEVENVSEDAEVFIQAGEIVKGGKQDRLFASDLLVPPRSGKVPVPSFCVERGRWSQRGREVAARFSTSSTQVVSRNLKLAGGGFQISGGLGGFQVGGGFGGFQVGGGLGGFQVGGGLGGFQIGGGLGGFQVGGGLGGFQIGGGLGGFQIGGGLGGFQVGGGNFNGFSGQFGIQGGQPAFQGGQFGLQGGVWNQVTMLQDKLTKNVGAEVRAGLSTSSLQLTLENDQVRKATAEYVRKLARATDGKEDAIGCAIVINGEVQGAEVYASSAFFRKVWPRLLQASAVEALAEWQKDQVHQPPSTEDVAVCLRDGDKGYPSEQDINDRLRIVMRETQGAIQIETRDRRHEDRWLHRSHVIFEKVRPVYFRVLEGFPGESTSPPPLLP